MQDEVLDNDHLYLLLTSPLTLLLLDKRHSLLFLPVVVINSHSREILSWTTDNNFLIQHMIVAFFCNDSVLRDVGQSKDI